MPSCEKLTFYEIIKDSTNDMNLQVSKNGRMRTIRSGMSHGTSRLFTKEPHSSQNGKKIFTAKDTKDVKTKGIFE